MFRFFLSRWPFVRWIKILVITAERLPTTGETLISVLVLIIRRCHWSLNDSARSSPGLPVLDTDHRPPPLVHPVGRRAFPDRRNSRGSGLIGFSSWRLSRPLHCINPGNVQSCSVGQLLERAYCLRVSSGDDRRLFLSARRSNRKAHVRERERERQRESGVTRNACLVIS